VIVTNLIGSSLSSNAALSVIYPPVITSQPTGILVLPGTNVTFFVSIGGTPPFAYNWRFNGTNILDATNTSYTIASVATNNAGNYSVVVSNFAGSVTSSNAILTVATPPIITAQPLSSTNNVNTTANFSVTAASVLPLSYQWQQNGTNLVNGGKYSGATTNVLTISGVTSNEVAFYSVIITNQAGSVTSSNATLTITYPPNITVQPTSLLVLPGTNVAFAATLGGAPPFSYRWLFNGTNLPSGTNASYAIATVLTNNAGNYSVVITNSAGSVTSSIAVLTVLVSPTNQIKAATSNATFTVTAFNPVALAYQWLQNGTNLVNGGKFSGVTTNALTITGVSSNEAGIYTVLVTNTAGNNTAGNVTSSNALLTVVYPPIITQQPVGQRIVLNNSFVFNVGVNGTDPFNYQWRFNAGNLLGATNSIYAIPAVITNNTGVYSVVVSNFAGSVTSSNALLVVLVPPSLALQFWAGYPLLNLNGMLSNNFTVQYSTDLTGTNWITLQTFSNLLTSPYLFLDPAGVVPPARFYRVFMQ
jgi:hypothetical protein